MEKSHRGTNRSLNRRNRGERPARRTEDRKKGRFQSRPFLLPPSQGSSLSRFPAVFGLFHSHSLLSSSSSSLDRRLSDPWTLSVNVPSSMTSDCRKIFFCEKKWEAGGRSRSWCESTEFQIEVELYSAQKSTQNISILSIPTSKKKLSREELKVFAVSEKKEYGAEVVISEHT